MKAATGARPRLYHAAPSYYSMIARLTLVETGCPFDSVVLDIHRRLQQLEPDYVRLNPNMTVPTLVSTEGIVADSRDILAGAFRTPPGSDAALWLDRLYAFPVEELTMGRLMVTNPLARLLFPRVLRRVHDKLLALADRHPDLAAAYRRRAEVFAARIRTFDPAEAATLYARRWEEARALLDGLDGALARSDGFIGGEGYGPVDVVATVFLARIAFVGQASAIAARPALSRYVAGMQARPSYRGADIWSRLHPLGMLRQIFA